MTRLKRSGFSILELILVLGIASSVSFMKFQDLRNEQEKHIATSVGEQIKQVGVAVNAYINIHYDKISTLTSIAAGSGTGTDPGPRTCSNTNNTCTITYQTLINDGLLPSSFSGLNANRSPYNISLKRTGSAPNYLINGLITTTNPWMEGTDIRYDLLGKAMQSAGVDSGMSKTATTLSGYSGTWAEQASNYTTINKAGILGYRVGYDSSMYSVFLRRDGSLPMTGDLNMGGKNITNVQDMTASGSITSNQLQSTGSTSVGTNLNVNGTTILNGATSINSGLTVSGTTQLQSNVVISGNTFTDGYLQVNNNIVASKNITAGYNVSAGNWLFAKNQPGDQIGLGGDESGDYELKLFTPDKYLTVWWPSYYHQKEQYIDKTIFQTWGGISADGFVKSSTYISAGGNITSGGNIEGQYLRSTSTAILGNACNSDGSSTGAISKDSSGELLTCQSGIWRRQSNVLAFNEIDASGVANSGAYAGCAVAVPFSKRYSFNFNSATSEIFSTSVTASGVQNPLSEITVCIFVNNNLCSAQSKIMDYTTGNASCMKRVNPGTNNVTYIVGNNLGVSRFLIQYLRLAE